MLRRGFSPPQVYNSRDLLKEIAELGDYTADDVVASEYDDSPMKRNWRQCEIKERATDDVIAIVLAQSDKYLDNILGAARIAGEN